MKAKKRTTKTRLKELRRALLTSWGLTSPVTELERQFVRNISDEHMEDAYSVLTNRRPVLFDSQRYKLKRRIKPQILTFRRIPWSELKP